MVEKISGYLKLLKSEIDKSLLLDDQLIRKTSTNHKCCPLSPFEYSPHYSGRSLIVTSSEEGEGKRLLICNVLQGLPEDSSSAEVEEMPGRCRKKSQPEGKKKTSRSIACP